MNDPESDFQVSVQMNEKSFSVPRHSAIVSPDGLFLSGIRMAEGTRLTVRIRKGRECIALPGVVCKDCGELGAAVRFERAVSAESQALAHMLASHMAPLRRSVLSGDQPDPEAAATPGKS